MNIRTLLPPWKKRVRLLETFVATHQTGGLPGFPAIDLFAPPGTPVIVPETCELIYPHLIQWDHTARIGGWTAYLHGLSGATYFVTHFGRIADRGTYAAGESIGTVGFVPATNGVQWWEPHIHEGKSPNLFVPPGV